MPWFVSVLALLAAQFTGTALLAQNAEPFLGHWVGKGALSPVDADKTTRPLACRYRGIAQGNEVLIRLRCATRQNARVFEVRLSYGQANRIVLAEIVRPVSEAGQRLDITQDENGLTVFDTGGGRLEVRQVQDGLRLTMTDPDHGRGEVALRRKGDS